MPGKVQPAKYTVAQRIAITENMSLMALLTEAKTPHAKELAMIVLARIAAIAGGADLWPQSNDDVQNVVEFARLNCDPDMLKAEGS